MTLKNRTVFIDADAHILYGPPNMTGSPERRLLLAILERAILDYVGNDQKEVDEAEAWIFDSDTINPRKDNFSFDWVCEELDLCPSQVTHAIKTMPKRGNRRVAPWYFAQAS